MNAIEWGGRLDPNALAQIDCWRTRRFIMCRIADPGEGFDQEKLERETITVRATAPLDHGQARERKGLRPGGYGILLAKSLVDDLVYNEAHNEVAMIKYLS
jgi:anti-sigma regulatory factor (Ser/Thr protein kinase)